MTAMKESLDRSTDDWGTALGPWLQHAAVHILRVNPASFQQPVFSALRATAVVVRALIALTTWATTAWPPRRSLAGTLADKCNKPAAGLRMLQELLVDVHTLCISTIHSSYWPHWEGFSDSGSALSTGFTAVLESIPWASDLWP
ncbi:uncharacterized protein BXZ73DRAFT_98440 [Epithele typhae]|uniref:uncharacterized protein n=1 Tax=Epithele typhae TaxID=378194 RepID=UPI0020087977|nr:uncharacterized protein BXZ73DRAFT_98440 [Epithele typhae]KAH9941226.1 hypothetical protein BXZ73DRAFT_98440 [Epithele typhae]